MLKKPITFEDLDGNMVTEDFYFNLNKAEVAELELSKEGGLSGYLGKIGASNEPKEIMEAFKSIIAFTVGRRSEDGRRFVKSQEITDEFFQSNAFSEFFLEMIQDADKSAEFINAVVPQSLRDEAAKVASSRGTQTVELPATADAIQANIDRVQAGSTPKETMPPDNELGNNYPYLQPGENVDTDDRPDWLKEGRVPTKDELRDATPDQLQAAFSMKIDSHRQNR